MAEKNARNATVRLLRRKYYKRMIDGPFLNKDAAVNKNAIRIRIITVAVRPIGSTMGPYLKRNYFVFFASRSGANSTYSD